MEDKNKKQESKKVEEEKKIEQEKEVERLQLQSEVDNLTVAISGLKMNLKFLEDYYSQNIDILSESKRSDLDKGIKSIKREVVAHQFDLEKLSESILITSLVDKASLSYEEEQVFSDFLRKLSFGKIEEASLILENKNIGFLQFDVDAKELMKSAILKYWEGKRDVGKKDVIDFIAEWRLFFPKIQDVIQEGSVREILTIKFNTFK